jgi:hypothetical protein
LETRKKQFVQNFEKTILDRIGEAQFKAILEAIGIDYTLWRE